MTDKLTFGLRPPDPPPPPARKLEIIQGEGSGDGRYHRNAEFVLCPLTDTSANILHIFGTGTKADRQTYRLVAYVNNATPHDLEVIKALLRVL